MPLAEYDCPLYHYSYRDLISPCDHWQNWWADQLVWIALVFLEYLVHETPRRLDPLTHAHHLVPLALHLWHLWPRRAPLDAYRS